jgi:hypothetical protein
LVLDGPKQPLIFPFLAFAYKKNQTTSYSLIIGQKMLRTTFLLAFTALAMALPQPQAAGPPTATVTPPSSTIGQLPKDGLKMLPFPGFEGLASVLGFDIAKATPEAGGYVCFPPPLFSLFVFASKTS